MSNRLTGGPMDFEYENKFGPTAHDSPWPKADPNRRQGFGSTFEPQKSPFQPNSLFGAAASKIPLPQTPLKPPPSWREQPDTDFSEANQSSPEQADTEDTPDYPRTTKELGKNISVSRGKSPSKAITKKEKSPSRRDSLFGSIGDFASSLTGMGNVFVIGPQFVSGDRDRDRYSSRSLQRKGRKRSRKEFDQDNQIFRRQDDFSDMDDSRPSSREGAQEQSMGEKVKEMGTIPTVLSFINHHPDLPQVLGYYVTLFVNIALMGLFCWAVLLTWRAFGNEIDIEVRKKAEEILRENAECSSHYLLNRCGPDSETPPALRSQCAEWLDCMNRDPDRIGRTSISAGTFATIINSFVEKLSWKTIITFTMLFLALISLPRLIFGAIVGRSPSSVPHYPPPQQHPSHYMQSPYAPTPQHQQFYTPQHQRIGQPMDYEPSPSKRERNSPRKLGYQ